MGMSRFQPALLGGLFIGVLSSLPFVNLVNVCCCLWVVVGGLLTVYLQRQAPLEPGRNDATEAVLGGLMAGLVGGVISAVVGAILTGLVSPGEVDDFLSRLPDMPSDLRDRIVQLTASGGFRVLTAVVTVVMYAVVATVGALIGMAFFKRKPAPPPEPVS
jgi:hypothetical protein